MCVADAPSGPLPPRSHSIPPTDHFHGDVACEYAPNAAGSTLVSTLVKSTATTTGHSALVGISMDGFGIYGAYESSGAVPTNLDACHAHTGTVPGTVSSAIAPTSTSGTAFGISGLASSSVRHYHLSSTFPYTIGCYSPTTVTYAGCQAFTKNSVFCNTYLPVYTSTGALFYWDDWCPCATNSSYEGGLPMAAVGTLPSTLYSTAKCYSTSYITGSGVSSPPTTTTGATTCVSLTGTSATTTLSTSSSTGRHLLTAANITWFTTAHANASVYAVADACGVDPSTVTLTTIAASSSVTNGVDLTFWVASESTQATNISAALTSLTPYQFQKWGMTEVASMVPPAHPLFGPPGEGGPPPPADQSHLPPPPSGGLQQRPCPPVCASPPPPPVASPPPGGASSAAAALFKVKLPVTSLLLVAAAQMIV